ncbi:MAG TPA: MFS transporter [Burkholderiales bacterium]|nr:MFS transporter [Burkholderiales bacterium]
MSGTRWPAVWAVFAGGLVCGAYIGKVPPALPLQRAELGLTLVQSGFIATTFNVIGMAVGMFVGILCDRFGHKLLGLVGLATLLAAGLFGAAAWNFPSLLVSRFFEGVGFILFTVAGSALMAAAAAEHRDRAKVMGLWSAYMPSGGSLALLLSPLALAIWGWRGLWVATAIAAAVAFVLIARLAPTTRYGGVGSLKLALESLAQPGSVALALLFAFYVAQWTSVMIWLPTFLMDERGASAGLASFLTALMVLINVPGNLGGGWLLGHGVRRGPLILAASAVMVVTDIGMLSSALPDGLRYAACLAFSLCVGVIPACIFSGVVVHAKTPQHVGTTNGMVMQTSQAGQFFGPVALAWLASNFGGWGASLWAMLAFAACAALCGYAVLRIEAR